MPALRLCLALLLALGAGAAARPAAHYENPVIDADFPDPAVLRAADGVYYVYATQSARDGHMLNIQTARSPDLVHWELLGDALPARPVWASRTQDFWAPHVVVHGGVYYLYYSARPDAAQSDPGRGLCLAVATSARPQGPFTDIGHPLLCGPGFVNIDPMAYDDPATGRRLLYWGSGFQPIKVQELGADRTSFAPGSRAIDLVPPVQVQDPANYRRLVEGAWLVRHAGFYYLFFSGDNCCGPNAHYAVMVARSRSATGPFALPPAGSGLPGGVIIARRGLWVAPGHNSVIEDGCGMSWILYHGVDRRLPRTRPSDEVNTRRVMLLDRLVWRNGWPRVAGDGPSTGRQAGPCPAAPRAISSQIERSDDSEIAANQ
jgi:arabinan endo-1,5-alpha-L-arabinosidase